MTAELSVLLDQMKAKTQPLIDARIATELFSPQVVAALADVAAAAEKRRHASLRAEMHDADIELTDALALLRSVLAGKENSDETR